MERKIGEIFEYNGEWYQVVKSNSECCKGCAFYEKGCKAKYADVGSCGTSREDWTQVIFKKLEKVGEPYEFDGHIFQSYHTFEVPIFTENYATVREYGNNSKISIEIKQNKEDMEEKVQCCDNRFEIIAKAKEALLKETNIARDEQEMAVIDNILFRCWQMGWLDKYDDTKHSNSEKIGKNLKEFDLEAAKAGKPVCTRDGHKARIICFDLKAEKPIVALITNDDKEEAHFYYNNGRSNQYQGYRYDLMMLPEKKEGWVNIMEGTAGKIYVGNNIYRTEDEAKEGASRFTSKLIASVPIEWEE